MGATHGKPRPTVRSTIGDQNDDSINESEYSDYMDDVFDEDEPRQNGTIPHLRLWDFPYSSTKHGHPIASDSALTRRELYSESDVTPPKRDYGTILNHGRKRIQSAKEIRTNRPTKRSSLLRKLFTKTEKKSDPDSDVYQANSFHRLCLHTESSTGNMMGIPCSTAKNPDNFSNRQNEFFCRTCPHKREFQEVTDERRTMGLRHNRSPHITNSCTENDKNRSNIDNDIVINGRNSADIWVGEVPVCNVKKDAHNYSTVDHSSVDGINDHSSKSVVVVRPQRRTRSGSDDDGIQQLSKPQLNVGPRQRKLTPAVPLSIPMFKAQTSQSTLPPIGDVEEEVGHDDDHRTTTAASSLSIAKLNSTPCSSSWPNLSLGDYRRRSKSPSSHHRRLLSPSPKQIEITARQSCEIPKKKLVRKLTPIILQVPKNLEGRNHSTSDDELGVEGSESHGVVYGYDSRTNGLRQLNGPSEEYKEELRNTVEELIDQLSPTIMGDDFVDKPIGRPSPSFRSKSTRNFVFPDVRVENRRSEPFSYAGNLSPLMARSHVNVPRRKITPVPSLHQPHYSLDAEKTAFSSSSLVEDEDHKDTNN